MTEKTSEKSELVERIIRVNRVAKVVKGGRRFSFSALVVVGDGKGKVGFGLGKANEVTEAIRKGISNASKTMKTVVPDEHTISHVVKGHYGAGSVLLRPAPRGHGIIAAGPIRAMMEAAGINDITAKCLGTRNPHNVVRATFNGLLQLKSFDEVAKRRGKDVEFLKATI
ncbi:30S ribosomal protein S5 [Deltaproteobacteria bacterium TL4]